MPINGCESLVSFDGGVTKKFSEVGEFANPESMNREDRLCLLYFKETGSARPAGRRGEAEGPRLASPPPMSSVDMGHCAEHCLFCSADAKPVDRNV